MGVKTRVHAGPAPAKYATQKSLSALYVRKTDPWGTQTWIEKQVRYALINNILRTRQFHRALDISCGEGQLTGNIFRHSTETTGVDISREAIRTAAGNHRKIRFMTRNIRRIPEYFFRQFDAIFWIDAIYWLTRKESSMLLKRIARARGQKSGYLMVSARIIPRTAVKLSFWAGHDFETAAEFESHISSFFPTAEFCPAQINLNLQKIHSLSPAQKIMRMGLAAVNRMLGYVFLLKICGKLYKNACTKNLVAPFIVHHLATAG